MKKQAVLPLILTLIFCFGLVSLVQAEQPGNNPPLLTDPATGNACDWADHRPNTRFAICDVNDDNLPLDPAYFVDDLVWDRDTDHVWPRDANAIGTAPTWQDAIDACRNFDGGNRRGWNFPTIDQLFSLMPSMKVVFKGDPLLPEGHPFINVRVGTGDPPTVVLDEAYWSFTTYESDDTRAYFAIFGTGLGFARERTADKVNGLPGPPPMTFFVWCVR